MRQVIVTLKPKEKMNYSWSKKEKEIAKRAFELAHHNKIKKIIEGIKSHKLDDWEDIVSLKAFIKKKEKEAEMVLDYRYSVLVLSFASFIREGLISLKEIQGFLQFHPVILLGG